MKRHVLGILVSSLLALAVDAGCGDDRPTTTTIDHATEPTCPCRLATKFANLALCVSPTTAFAPAHVYSTSWDATQMTSSCDPYRDPQPAPSAPWTTVQVSSACNASSLSSDDCTLAMRCSDIAYTTPNQIVDLAPLAGWTAESSACAQRQEQVGAYLELSLSSDKLGCGMGLDQVTRIPVCPARCQTDPSATGCEICSNGSILTTL
jgi:hypothetical protein